MSIIDDAPRSATVTAKENTEVIIIELSRYMLSLESSNPMMHLILRLVLSRFRQASPQTNDGITTSGTEKNSMNEIRSLALEKIRFAATRLRQGVAEEKKTCPHSEVPDWISHHCKRRVPQFDCIFDDNQGGVQTQLKIFY